MYMNFIFNVVHHCVMETRNLWGSLLGEASMKNHAQSGRR